MIKMIDHAKLERYFDASITLSQQVSDPEHRANPFVNILNLSTKSAIQYPDLLAKKTLYWRLTIAALVTAKVYHDSLLIQTNN